MFHFSQLAVVSEQTTDIVTWISIGAIALLAVVLAVTCIVGKKFSTSEIAFAGVCIASSVTLSFIKIAPVQYGGSITLARLVPPLIYAYKFGPVKGTLAGIVIGLFDFITNPYILTPMTFVLDYILAFASIGLMGFAPKFGKLPTTAKVVIGTVIVYIARFTLRKNRSGRTCLCRICSFTRLCISACTCPPTARLREFRFTRLQRQKRLTSCSRL